MVTKTDIKLGKRIRQLRRKLRLTQEELADAVDVSTKYIQYLESAKRVPSLKLLYRIAHILQIKVKDLFTF